MLMEGCVTIAGPIYQYDYGQRLVFNGTGLPGSYEVHFSNAERGKTVTKLGDETGVDIPDALLQSGENIHVWVFLHSGADDGETVYHCQIIVKKRGKPTSEEPTPVQQNIITQAIAALNAAVTQTAEDVVNTGAAKTAAEAAQGAAERAQGAAERAQGSAETAQRAAERAQGAAKTAKGKAEAAQEASESARDRAIREAQAAAADADKAEQAANISGYMFIEMNSSGHLIYTRTPAAETDFDIDEDGHLILEVG